jgi:hypothetical protein
MKSSEVLMNYKSPTLPDIQSKAKEFDNLRGMVEGEQYLYTLGYQDGYLQCLEDLKNGLVVSKEL